MFEKSPDLASGFWDGELAVRHARLKSNLMSLCPEAEGLLVFSRPSIYYLTGTYASGALYFPLTGEPMLAVRKGEERARLESPLKNICVFRSYGELSGLAAGFGTPFPMALGVEQSGLSWNLGLNLSSRLKDVRLIPADRALQKTRAVKTPWEVAHLIETARRHARALEVELPARLEARLRESGGNKGGVSEREISLLAWDVFYELGHCGIMRMAAQGEEIFLGHVAAGENGNYPSYYNGPLGVKGVCPAVPYMGSASSLWERHAILAVDVGFALDGYMTDKTQLYFNGPLSALPKEARKAQDCALEIQSALAARLKPGAIPAELYALGLDLAARRGFAAGYMGMGGNKVNFTGHSLGLQVDEWPVIAAGFNEPLEENMLFALEPKISLPGFGMLGVENTFLVMGEEASLSGASLACNNLTTLAAHQGRAGSGLCENAGEIIAIG